MTQEDGAALKTETQKESNKHFATFFENLQQLVGSSLKAEICDKQSGRTHRTGRKKTRKCGRRVDQQPYS
jgi:hypothetical protein